MNINHAFYYDFNIASNSNVCNTGLAGLNQAV